MICIRLFKEISLKLRMDEKRLALLKQNKQIRLYLEGKMSIDDLRLLAKSNIDVLLTPGVTQTDIQELLAEGEHTDIQRLASFARFARFVKKLGLDVATPEGKVAAIKAISAERFLDLLSISRGLLYGLFHFKKFSPGPGAIVEGMGTMVLDPPENSSEEFKRFYSLMQQDITIDNLPKWAAKLYAAIIYAHMFPDGNGRLARNAYIILRTTPRSEKPESQTKVRKICNFINEYAMATLFRKNGIDVKTHPTNYYLAEDKTRGEWYMFEQNLRYVASRRLLQKWRLWSGLSPEKQRWIDCTNWTTEQKSEYDEEYKKLKTEFYWTVIEFADKYAREFIEELDEALL